jgi:hypothetical protein
MPINKELNRNSDFSDQIAPLLAAIQKGSNETQVKLLAMLHVSKGQWLRWTAPLRQGKPIKFDGKIIENAKVAQIPNIDTLVAIYQRGMDLGFIDADVPGCEGLCKLLKNYLTDGARQRRGKIVRKFLNEWIAAILVEENNLKLYLSLPHQLAAVLGEELVECLKKTLPFPPNDTWGHPKARSVVLAPQPDYSEIIRLRKNSVRPSELSDEYKKIKQFRKENAWQHKDAFELNSKMMEDMAATFGAALHAYAEQIKAEQITYYQECLEYELEQKEVMKDFDYGADQSQHKLFPSASVKTNKPKK